MARYISVTSATYTRNGANVTYSITFKCTDEAWYVQLRTADGRTTSASGWGTKTVTDTVTRTVYSPGAGSATQSADYYYQPETTGEMKYSESLSYTIRWTGMNISVTFDASPGTTPTETKTVVYGTAYGELPTPVRSGYAFTGWFTSANGGTQITEESIVNVTEAQILYAHWEAMTIVRIVEGGSVTTYTKVYAVQSGNVKHVLSIFVVKDGTVKQAT